jgi:hypothetical protein
VDEPADRVGTDLAAHSRERVLVGRNHLDVLVAAAAEHNRENSNTPEPTPPTHR